MVTKVNVLRSPMDRLASTVSGNKQVVGESRKAASKSECLNRHDNLRPCTTYIQKTVATLPGARLPGRYDAADHARSEERRVGKECPV